MRVQQCLVVRVFHHHCHHHCTHHRATTRRFFLTTATTLFSPRRYPTTLHSPHCPITLRCIQGSFSVAIPTRRTYPGVTPRLKSLSIATLPGYYHSITCSMKGHPINIKHILLQRWLIVNQINTQYQRFIGHNFIVTFRHTVITHDMRVAKCRNMHIVCLHIHIQ